MIHARFLSGILSLICVTAFSADGNRLTYLDGNDPFYVDGNFPKLTTPQWIGETNVDAVVVLAIDDMRDPAKYETFLRPILDRLKKDDGRAHLSIMANALDPAHPQLTNWLAEGVSIEVHTLSHPCPLLAGGNFSAAENTYFGGIELLARIPGNQPVAYRMPCCDSMNSPSPRFYAEIFNRLSPENRYLQIDSSVMNLMTADDASLPAELKEAMTNRFTRYLPSTTNSVTRITMKSFVTTIENYPYPFVIGNLCWEFPGAIPSDWEAQNVQGTNQPRTMDDWKFLLDVTVAKQGVLNLIFHPHGWIRNDQIVELIDYAQTKYGGKVKFLNFREALERLNQHLLAGSPIRNSEGQDAGVRLIDLNHDGYLDLLIGNQGKHATRLWLPMENKWKEAALPFSIVSGNGVHASRFGIAPDRSVMAMTLSSNGAGIWTWENFQWRESKALSAGLGPTFVPQTNQIDPGLQFRDLDGDGVSELLIANPLQSAIFRWDEKKASWQKLNYSLPRDVWIADQAGRDTGLRFVDLNADGFDDLVYSNEKKSEVYLFVSKPVENLRWTVGWSRKARSAKAGEKGAVPGIVRDGDHPNNGAWFRKGSLWIQNEDTAHLPDKVDRRSFEELISFEAPAPLSPEDSLKAFRVAEGFQIELAASEPLVLDPVAFDWGADGKLWVVEMADYPSGVDGKGKPGGSVRFLEDTNHDGRYDRSTLFLENLNFPTGVLPWRKGVIVSAAPEIFYAEDTNGDGKADFRKTLLTGFGEGNQQHRVNGFDYGLDNWVYGANGDSGGNIRVVGALDPKAKLSEMAVAIRGRDFRFQPDKGLFEAVEGQTQFGRHRDDWGNWFGNNNPNWLWHYAMPERYLLRNPHLPVATTKIFLANYPNNTRALSISRPMTRFNWPDLINIVTSANSPMPYRDDLFPGDYRNSIYISEPAHNLIHREILEPDGVSFRSRRGPAEADREFIASADNWFRPIMIKTGPDGALYFADMYRLVIEHLEYALPGMEKQIDVRAGDDKGRIYRVYPKGASLRSFKRMDGLKVQELTEALNNSNGWQRDTAQRLLAHLGDPKAENLLARQFLQNQKNQRAPNSREFESSSETAAKIRVQILGTLDGMDSLTSALLETALKDPHPAVRESAVRLSEKILKNQERKEERLRAAFYQLARDENIRVRYQLAFSLGEASSAQGAEALAEIALRDRDNPLVQQAVLSSAPRHAADLLKLVFRKGSATKLPGLVTHLFQLAMINADEASLVFGLNELAKTDRAFRFEITAAILKSIEDRFGSLGQWHAKAAPALQKGIETLDHTIIEARASNHSASDLLRVIPLLGRGLQHRARDLELLQNFLTPQYEPQIGIAALKVLAGQADQPVMDRVFTNWTFLTPAVRTELLQISLSREAWSRRLLAALQSGQVKVVEIPQNYQQQLLTHRNTSVRDLAGKFFSTTDPDREKILQQYVGVATLTGNTSNGMTLFNAQCRACHSFQGEGGRVGPNLDTLTDKSPATLLAAILDPNRAVEAPFVNYLATTRRGEEFQGVIASESGNSLTLRLASGEEKVVLRADLTELRSSGLSIMPEGFEKALTVQAMADLIRFLQEPPSR